MKNPVVNPAHAFALCYAAMVCLAIAVNLMPIFLTTLRVDLGGRAGLRWAPDHFLGRPPFLPHCESLFLYLWVVAFPPFLPMHRGQIILVRGCSGQYFSLATAYFYLKTPLRSHPLAFFFLCRPACPSPTSTLCT
jgi:hypothetical protein